MKNTLLIAFCLMVFGSSQAQNEIKQDTIAKKMAEVAVNGKTKTFHNKNGNIKIDVANSAFKSVPNTLDLLAKLPNIQISPNKESISVIGKGNPLIYIDNQKAGLNDLNSLSVDDIKSIEIINNPSSKYEAEGKVVILITRKWSKKEGFKVDLTQNFTFKKQYNNYFGVNTSVKKKKLEFKANFDYNQLQIWEKHRMDYEIQDQNILSNYEVEAFTNRTQFIFGGGLFYKINEDDYFSFSANGRKQREPFGINTQTFNRQNTVENNTLTKSDNLSNRNFINSFVNYSKKIKPMNLVLFSGLQYSNFNHDINTLVENNNNNTQFEKAQNRNQEFNVEVFSGRTDIEKVFKNEMKLEVGGLYLNANAKTHLDIFDYTTVDSNVSNYNLNEQNTSGYTQLSGKIKKLGYSFGFRVENTRILGKNKNESTPVIKKNYTDFFPKMQFDIPIDSTKSITLNYSKSIVRPNYSTINNASAYINPYFIYGGNVNLDPAINNEIAANFQYNESSVRLSYYQNSNPVFANFSYDDQQHILTFSQKNFKKATGFDLTLTVPFTYKFWTTNNSLSFLLDKIEDQSAMQNESKPYLYFYSNHVFKLPKEYGVSLTAWGLTTQKQGIFEIQQPKFVMDLIISKTYFKNWDCALSFGDIFRNNVFKQNFTISKVYSNARYLMDTQEVSLSVKYSFGKIKDAEFKEKSINETENRIR